MSNDPTTNTVFSWKIDNLEIISNLDTLQDVIKSIHYTYTGTCDTYTAQINGVVGLDPPNASSYIPYQELTKAQVISWLQTKYDIGLFNKNIIEQIQAQIPTAPVTIKYSIPWTTDVSGNTLDVSGNEIVDVSGNTLDIIGNEIVDVSGNEIVDVSGNEIVDVSGNEIVDVSGNEIVDVSGNEIVDVSGNTLDVSGN
jgi:hypothetical protein